MIFAWDDLKALAAVNIDSARDKLIDIMSNYQGYVGCELILVFDAYKVKQNPGSIKSMEISMWSIRKKQRLPICI